MRKICFWQWVVFFCMPFALIAGDESTLSVDDPTIERKPWSVLLYHGLTSDKTLGQTIGGQFRYTRKDLYSVDFGYQLKEENAFRKFFGRLVDFVEVHGNVTYRRGNESYHNEILEFAPYVAWRWDRFPWKNHLYTTFAIGQGISYATSVPQVEERTKKPGDNTKKLLNYLMLEVTAALPKYKNISLVFRIHHRSGAYGLYGAGNSGSNVIGLGLKFNF